MSDETIGCPFCEQPVPINALPAHVVDVHSEWVFQIPGLLEQQQ